MAKYNIYGHVLYSEIQYEKLMYITERIFINALMNKIPSIKQWTDDIWDNIDHEYMINTLNQIKIDAIENDIELMLEYKNMPVNIQNILKKTEELDDIFSINKIERFKYVERAYSKSISKKYKKRFNTIMHENVDEFTYLTEQIKHFNELEQTIPYFSKGGEIVRRVTPSTYLSMLYNVNITRTGWNQSFKDAEYFERDLMILETHPRSCPLCAPMQGKVYSKSGKSKMYDPIDVAYDNGVGHPNCKCNWGIYWSPDQLKTQRLSETKGDEYEVDQKKKATERAIRKAENDMNLYNMIGNQEEVDKTVKKIERLREKLVS